MKQTYFKWPVQGYTEELQLTVYYCVAVVFDDTYFNYTITAFSQDNLSTTGSTQ